MHLVAVLEQKRYQLEVVLEDNKMQRTEIDFGSRLIEIEELRALVPVLLVVGDGEADCIRLLEVKRLNQRSIKQTVPHMQIASFLQ